MTDKEKLTALLDEFGIKYKEDGAEIYCEEGGYPGFFTQFSFDKAGKFQEMGAYE